jgi:glucan phosphoethanolaminetransferase (alkaline phosphatase superfamily)
MRVKLILLTSLVAATFGIGITIAVVSATFTVWAFTRSAGSGPGFYLALCAPLILTGILSGIFVYRHTSRRRKLQSVITALLVVILCLGGLMLVERILTLVD